MQALLTGFTYDRRRNTRKNARRRASEPGISFNNNAFEIYDDLSTSLKKKKTGSRSLNSTPTNDKKKIGITPSINANQNSIISIHSRPKPNRNMIIRKTCKITPVPSIKTHKNNIKNNIKNNENSNSNDGLTPQPTSKTKKTQNKSKKSPYNGSMTRGSTYTVTLRDSSRNRGRSHSFSISRNSHTYSCQLTKSRQHIPPQHYSPSITHYTPQQSSINYNAYDNDIIEITPPPQPLPLPIPLPNDLQYQHQPKKDKNRFFRKRRKRSKSLSHSYNSQSNKSSKSINKKSKSKSISNKSATEYIDIPPFMLDGNKNKSPKTVQINNGKSLLFSSWFSIWTNDNNKNNTCNDDDICQQDIDIALNCLKDNQTDDNSLNVKQWKDNHKNQSITTTLKPPRKRSNDNKKEDLMSFRDFVARENRRALQMEDVNSKNIKREYEIKLKKPSMNKMNNKITSNKNPSHIEKFTILKGNTIKIDYGLPDGPFTQYKFIINFNKSLLKSKSYDDNIDISSSKESNWNIRKRYSDFIPFHNNLLTELKSMTQFKSKTIKLPKLPPKTFKKNFNSSFIALRHSALLNYLNRIISIRELSSSVTLLTFIGALNNHTMAYNNKYLESRMTLNVYISNYADTGDVLLFETKSYMAASLRSVTSSNYDHVGVVYRDINNRLNNGTSGPGSSTSKYLKNNCLYLLESTCDGVKSYPLKKRLSQWSILCPQIVVRRLQLLKNGIQNKILPVYTAHDYAIKTHDFYSKSSEFVSAVNGLDYAIWTSVFRLNDIPFENKKSYFCSELVTAYFKYMNLLPNNVKSNRILPGHFSDDNINKLPFINSILMNETLLLFKLPAVGGAKHKHYSR